MRLILPNVLVEIDPAYGPLLFLAGPIRGGGDWQKKCCEFLQWHYDRPFYAIVPCRWGATHPLHGFAAEGKSDAFERQLSWERHYLNLAAKKGCLLFWLPCESATEPHPGPEPYAMDTRGELGEWRGRMMHDPALRVVVGAESGFHGLSQIQRNFNEALRCQFPIHATMQETVRAALAKL
ncbi:MAG: hypothetical protein QY323_00845 [Patescibacteria group bacterium]|nr:MAG: hypothetical protein QY323_00845 [Patescibacteria group bacterium]